MHYLNNNPNKTYRDEGKGQMDVSTSGWEGFWAKGESEPGAKKLNTNRQKLRRAWAKARRQESTPVVQHCKEMQRRQVVSVTLATVLNAISLTQFKVASLVAQLAKSQLVKSSFCYNVGDLGSIPGLRTPGEGKGYPLQYSGLENSKDCIDHGGRRVRHDWATFTFKSWNGCEYNFNIFIRNYFIIN